MLQAQEERALAKTALVGTEAALARKKMQHELQVQLVSNKEDAELIREDELDALRAEQQGPMSERSNMALHELHLDVVDYAHGSRAFTALSRSLPCLQQLQLLRLRTSGVVAFQAGDVLAIGRALEAWPLPRLHDVKGFA